MYSLSTRDNFFSSTEHVVGIGEVGIRWVRHGVEWADAKREFIEDVCIFCQIYRKTRGDTEIGVVFVFHQFSESLFLWCAVGLDKSEGPVRHISKILNVLAGFSEHLDSFHISQANDFPILGQFKRLHI